MSDKSDKQGDRDDIVISGMSGQFPNSRNINEFEYNLYNKVNMMDDKETRWKHFVPGNPTVFGKIPEPEKFDGTFFGVHQSHSDKMDCQMRIILEEAYKAVMDAGLNPSNLRGCNIGVYVGVSTSESEKELMFDTNATSGFGLLGSARALLSNRISFTLGITGPSLICDTACSSSMTALNLAYEHLRNGFVDAAIVGGSNILLNPYPSLQFSLLGVLSPTGTCHPFDESANGYVRSEVVSCIYLQKKSAARRVYATLVHAAMNCDGFKHEGITYPSGAVQAKLISSFYEKGKADANELGFLEAHSTGTIVGDPEECKAIDEAICQKRKSPLLVGSVKSNCGHGEAGSGVISLVKVLLTLNNNYIPPNLNCNILRKVIPSLNEGRLVVVTEKTKLTKPYVGINSFGFGGANAHALLKQFDKEKPSSPNEMTNDLPYLMVWSSRTEKGINTFFDNLESRPLNFEHLALLRSAQEGGIQGMMFRGYSILKPNNDPSNPKPVSVSRKIQHNDGVKRSVVWVFSGMGSQWVGMGKDILKIKVCAESILRSHTLLKAHGIDLIKVITSDDPAVFDYILHSFVGITAIQIALVDLLRQLNVTPDLIIGHSMGETACAYADGSLTAEQALIASYYRGKVSVDIPKIRGSMAAVGLGFKDIKGLLPPSIEVACHNSADSCTISGPIEDVSKFVEVLKSKNIFAREVPCSNIAYHSRYITQFGPRLLKYLKNVIPNPKLRSNKWISTSVPAQKWNLNENKYCSAEYHTNNLLSNVLFEESSAYLPSNALTIEIAPHALLQSVLKTCISDGIHIGLVRRNVKDNVVHLLESLGSFYANGSELLVDRLYPPIEWPVSRGTPTISDLIDFDHSYDHKVFYFVDNCVEFGVRKIQLHPKTDHKYLFGHKIDGRPLVPATFYIECVWRTFASMHSLREFDNMDVEFENVQFMRATTLSAKDDIDFVISIQRGTGAFEITESKTLIANGTIRAITGQTKPSTLISDNNNDPIQIGKKDFYKELKLRGFHYEADFQSVELATSDGSYGKVKWFNNWVTVLDCMLQLLIIPKDSRSLVLPVKLRTMRIYANHHKKLFSNEGEVEVFTNVSQKRLVGGGIEVIDLTASQVQRRKPPGEAVLEKYQFIPYMPAPKLLAHDISRCCVQLLLENQTITKCSVVEVLKSNEHDFAYLTGLEQAIDDLPNIQGSYVVMHVNTGDSDVQGEEGSNVTHVNAVEDLEGNVNILVIDESEFKSKFVALQPKLSSNAVILIKTNNQNLTENINLPQNYKSIAYFPCANNRCSVLTLAAINATEEVFLKISEGDKDFHWLEKLKGVIGKGVVLVSENEQFNGLIGLVNCLRKEPETANIRCIFIDDQRAPAFDPALPFYKNQLQLGLAINVYRKGQWGCYRHLELKPTYPAIQHEGHIRGAISHVGDFSTLHWQQGSLNKDGFNIRVVYSALNFRDVMHASGRLSLDDVGICRLEQSSIFGLEFSGLNLKTGKPIMGMLLCSAIASHIEKEPLIALDVPSKWSLREAATVPVVYITVYFAFFYTADIRTGKSILIHSGSGGVGIAAIRTAIAYGLEVFTTVSTPEKKDFLLKTFPKLKEQNIGNSRDCSFEDMIAKQTKGLGVDFVLNSLSEDKLKASLRCLAPKGHFLEIGKFDMANDSSIGLGVFFQGQSFHAVLADKLGEYGSELMDKIKAHIQMDIEKDIIQPLPTTVFKPAELEQAFRYLMTAKHIGKVLIEMRDDIKSPVTHPVSAVPKVFFDEKLSYAMPGGLGGFGLEMADWMILRGARKVVLNSRRGISDDYQKLRISLWQSYGCEIIVNTSDITTENGCLDLLTESMKLGPVGGIFNLAVLLKDGIFTNQTVETFQQSLGPKAMATKHLDKLSRKLCPKLHAFVIFSSVSCGRGNAGQTNYGMSNSIMERIVEDRVAAGLPGKAIQWGAVGEVGLVAAMAEGKIDINIGGTLQQRISSCLDVLDTLMSSPDPIVSSMVVAEKKTAAEGQTALQYVMNTLSILDIKSVSVSTTLAELGMDSLMGVEIKQTLERSYNIVLSPAELRSLTIDRLKELSESHKVMETVTENDNESNDVDDILKDLYGNINLNDFDPSDLVSVNDVNSNKTPIIIVPGVEGICSDIWHIIGKQLKAPSYVLQFLSKFKADNIHEIVDAAVNNVVNILESRKTKSFRIVAYSFGTVVAHILIKHLEDLGYSGNIVYIDGSPQWIETIGLGILKQSSALDTDKRGILISLKVLLTNEEYNACEDLITSSENREILFVSLHRYLKQIRTDEFANTAYQYIRALVYVMEIIKDTATYKAIQIIQSKISLIKPTVLTIDKIDPLYGLKTVTFNTIDEETIEGNHQSILKNESLPGLINKYFEL